MFLLEKNISTYSSLHRLEAHLLPAPADRLVRDRAVHAAVVVVAATAEQQCGILRTSEGGYISNVIDVSSTPQSSGKSATNVAATRRDREG